MPESDWLRKGSEGRSDARAKRSLYLCQGAGAGRASLSNSNDDDSRATNQCCRQGRYAWCWLSSVGAPAGLAVAVAASSEASEAHRRSTQ
ncbi:hypothetical protein L596_005137 [Steinernema carpocapsae]|uniref:Uncharacterized protein n=1 Tax=Steinernema carpocapsae TaxID=34508 RepID=A0A4U8UZ38_STECR|nr:hypothetical protein L596_005137 [Steinernema carpocapsae]